jgi:hypothetical protein
MATSADNVDTEHTEHPSVIRDDVVDDASPEVSVASSNDATRLATLTTSLKAHYHEVKNDTHSFAREVHHECFGCMQTFEVFEVFDFVRDNWRRFVYNPYLPAFHKPGWLLDYILGPYTLELLGFFLIDMWAGITVAMTLIPQVSAVLHGDDNKCSFV